MTQDDLMARWGFLPEDGGYVWDGANTAFVGAVYGDPVRVRREPSGWRVFQEIDLHTEAAKILSRDFEEPWQAVQDAVAQGVWSLGGNPPIPERQWNILEKIGKAYGQYWTRTKPWGTLLPWTKGINLGWLAVAARTSSAPNDLPTFDDCSRSGTSRTDLRITVAEGFVELVVNPQGEVQVHLIQPSADYRHWSQLHQGLALCEELPAAHNLLLAALPPQPKEGREQAATLRIVQGDVEFKRHAPITADQVKDLQRAALATQKGEPKPVFDPRLLRFADRFGQALEAGLPNYHPDMDLWWWTCSEPEVHLLLWRGRVIGRCDGPGYFAWVGPRPEGLSKEALQTWIMNMAPHFPLKEVGRLTEPG